jgi:hypothetical protein
MEFPEQSIKKAREVVEHYKRISRSKLDYAVAIYNNTFIHVGYGFSEAIKKGNCGMYFHEVAKETDCFTYVGIAYLVAREAGLKPRMWKGIGIKNIPEGADPDEIDTLDHNFITVEVGKNKTYILDPQMSMFGKAKFNTNDHVIEVHDKGRRSVINRHYAYLNEMSEGDFLNTIESNRSPEGGRKVLETTQRINAARGKPIYLGYYPETQEIKSSFRGHYVQFSPSDFSRLGIFDLTTKVFEDGDYDFRKGYLSLYNAFNSGWREPERAQVPLIIPVSEAERVWNIWDLLAKESGRKSSLNRASYIILEEMLLEGGFNSKFEIVPGSRASKVVQENSLQENLAIFKEAEINVIKSYLERISSDTFSFKDFLRYARYIRESDKAKAPDNPRGFIFSEENHIQILRSELENYKESIKTLCNAMIENAESRARFKEGNLHLAERAMNKIFERERTKTYFDIMASLRSSRYPVLFNVGADYELFKRQFNINKISIDNLKNGLTDKDLYRGAQQRLFLKLGQAVGFRDALFLAEYKHGLKKILNRISKK